MELVSIILPVFNGERYLFYAIESCLNQTYKNIELIIVNDCSTDRSAEIIASFSKLDNRILVISNKTNHRLPKSLNIGHEASRGDLITWISDDNIFMPNAIERMVTNIYNTQSDFVYSDFIQIDVNGKERRTFLLDEPEELIWRNIVGSCFLYKKKVYFSNQGYNPRYEMVEDYDFWLRAFLKFKMYHINEILYKYRIHDESLTSQIEDSNSISSKLFKEVKYAMFEKTFRKYNYPFTLQKLIIDFQRFNFVDYKVISENINEYIQFYSTLQNSRLNWHLVYLKKKFIQGIRSKRENQGLKSFLQLIILFNRVMNLNDYKTAMKILTYKIFNK